ncbi:MAG TPA: PEP/pyruvate-binding domain-containing protein, partial [Oceanobacillus sp.]|nr:PEP/pyruvate-binding domain-containing protein [Oceanobacillus sp.]
MTVAVAPPKKREAQTKVAKRWVFLFDEIDTVQEMLGGSWDKTRALLGGKGAGLGDMTRAGVPVPPGFTVT